MTDEEKAAEEYSIALLTRVESKKGPETVWADCAAAAFLAGVAWRDSHPKSVNEPIWDERNDEGELGD